jgi:hypothetical protein
MTEAFSERAENRQDRRLILLVVAVGSFLALLLASLAFTGRHVFVTKTILVPGLIGVAWIGKRSGAFVQDWMVFLGGVILFDAIRGFVYVMNSVLSRPAYMHYVILWEASWFGTSAVSIPLQDWLLHSRAGGYVTTVALLFHASHFAFFLLFGMSIWLRDRRAFATWALAMLATMACGLVGYALVPTGPPWLASQQSLIPPVRHLAREVYNLKLPTLHLVFDTNPVAAMPSLHEAFPTCCTWAAVRVWGRKGHILWIYSALMGLALIYLGEHYAVDLVAGFFVATAMHWVTTNNGHIRNWVDRFGWCWWGPYDHFVAAVALAFLSMLLTALALAIMPADVKPF